MPAGQLAAPWYPEPDNQQRLHLCQHRGEAKLTCRRVLSISDCHSPSKLPNMLWPKTAAVLAVPDQTMFGNVLGWWLSQMFIMRLQVAWLHSCADMNSVTFERLQCHTLCCNTLA